MPLVIKHSNPETPDEEIVAPYEALEKAKKPLGWFWLSVSVPWVWNLSGRNTLTFNSYLFFELSTAVVFSKYHWDSEAVSNKVNNDNYLLPDLILLTYLWNNLCQEQARVEQITSLLRGVATANNPPHLEHRTCSF